jgi:hypothetical protein
LSPPGLRDRLPDDHLAWFDAVEKMDLSTLTLV